MSSNFSQTSCLICQFSSEGLPQAGKKFSHHLKTAHKLTSEEYTIKYLLGNVIPKCPLCEKSPRYVAFYFKKFCHEHSHEAEIEGGKKGGKAPAWSKGLTKKTDTRVAKISERMKGDKNPFYNKNHSSVTKSKIAVSKTLTQTELYNRLKTRCDVQLISSCDDFIGRENKNLTFECKICNFNFDMSFAYFERGYECPNCCERIPPFFGKNHTDKTKNSIAENTRLSLNELNERMLKRNAEFQLLTPLDEYKSRQDQYLKFKCLTCNSVSEKTLQAFERGSLCKTCFPTASVQQLEVYDFVKSLVPNKTDIILSDRSVIGPLELDIWIPSRRLAIEYHGLYWHSGGHEETFDKRRHRAKYEACRNAGIRLIQLYSDEWISRRETCESVIRHALGGESMKINARDCQIHEVTVSNARVFLNKFHMAGYTNCSRRFALVHHIHGIVGMATTRRPIQKKHGLNLIELARLAFVSNVSVRGGTSKLLKHIEHEYELTHNGILSYAELRFSEGNSYAISGFTRVDDALHNYWYTDGITRFDRFKYRARKPLTEKQVAEAAGVRPIYGCGNAVYVKIWK